MRLPKLRTKVNNSDGIPVNEYLPLIKEGKLKTPLEIFIDLVQNGKFRVGSYLKLEILHYQKLINDNMTVEYDAFEAEKAVVWIENYCRLYEGDQAGQFIKLSIWQKAFINSIFGFFHYEKTEVRDNNGEITEIKEVRKRLITEFFLLIASGNGKTTLSAAISNYILNGLGLNSPKMYIAANTSEQAQICWTFLDRMIQQDPALKQLVVSRAEKPVAKMKLKNDGIAQAFSNNAKGQEGVNPNVVIFDEVHEFRAKEAKMVADLKKNAVKQSGQSIPPLFGEITTAGYVRNQYFDNRVGLLKQMLRDNKVRNLKTCIWLFEQDSIEELEDIENAQKSNPQLGYSLTKQGLADMFTKSKLDITSQSEVFTKNFNFPGKGGDILFGTEHMEYPKLPDELVFKAKGILDGKELYGYKIFELSENDLYKMYNTYFYQPQVFIGYDGSIGNYDLSVITFLVVRDGNYYVKQKALMLKKSLEERILKDRVDYKYYHRIGDLDLIEGDAIAEADIIAYIESIREKDKFNIMKLGIDPWGSNGIISFYNRGGLKKAVATSNDARYRKNTTKIIFDLKDLFANKKIHCDNELLKMCMANCELKEYSVDSTVSIQKIDDNARLRIDAVWSLIYAIKAHRLYEVEMLGGG